MDVEKMQDLIDLPLNHKMIMWVWKSEQRLKQYTSLDLRFEMIWVWMGRVMMWSFLILWLTKGFLGDAIVLSKDGQPRTYQIMRLFTNL